jgi:hypothetical protein
VTVGGEMADGGARAAAVVRRHRIGVGDRPGSVDEHDRPLAQHQALVVADRDHDQPVDAARHEGEQQLALRALLGATGEHECAVRDGDISHRRRAEH